MWFPCTSTLRFEWVISKLPDSSRHTPTAYCRGEFDFCYGPPNASPIIGCVLTLRIMIPDWELDVVSATPAGGTLWSDVTGLACADTAIALLEIICGPLASPLLAADHTIIARPKLGETRKNKHMRATGLMLDLERREGDVCLASLKETLSGREI